MIKKVILIVYITVLIWLIVCPTVGVAINVFSKEGHERVEAIVITSKICAAASLRFNTSEGDCYNYTSYYEFPLNIKKIETMTQKIQNPEWKNKALELIKKLNNDQQIQKEIFFTQLKNLQETIINTKF